MLNFIANESNMRICAFLCANLKISQKFWLDSKKMQGILPIIATFSRESKFALKIFFKIEGEKQCLNYENYPTKKTALGTF